MLFFSLTVNSVFACSCVGESTVEEAYNGSDVVISGNVISITKEWFPDSIRIKSIISQGFPTDNLDKELFGFYLNKVIVNVETTFKGHITSDTLIIYTGMSEGDCGYDFMVGYRYVIYGDTESFFARFNKDRDYPSGPNTFWTNICTRTQAHNRKEVRKLGKLLSVNGL